MKVALIYPPTGDPTAPYLSVPTLCGYLRSHSVEVLPIDANVGAYDFLLRRAPLESLAERLERRLARLDRKPALSHVEQLAYVALWKARGDAAAAPAAIAAAVATLRDPERFYDPVLYGQSVAAIASALRLVSAAHAPLTLDFTAYRTPFSLLDATAIEADARPERNPFHAYFSGPLTARLRAAGVGLVGISVAFPGQLQPAWSLAHVLRATLPGIRLVVGGPAITQILVRLSGDALERALRPFDSAVLFDGEEALLELARGLERGLASPPPLIRGSERPDMARLPAPDFDGLPLERYFAPEIVLPYDPTRGCYWGACTFCHYGLAETGTAAYRERPVDRTIEHLRELASKHGCSLFYFSQDAVAPKTILKLARAIRDAGLPWRWATDMRAEKTLKPEVCHELAAGGALSMALGVESGADRVLRLINKGIGVDTVRAAIGNLAAAGVAVETMCFTDFPTETGEEALATLRLLDASREQIALFVCGEFALTHGSVAAQRPHEIGIRETWQVAGDELGTGLFYAEARAAKSEADRAAIDAALAALSRRWLLRRYPWAGALSTAHTLLWYRHFGPAAFRALAAAPAAKVPGATPRAALGRFDLARLDAQSAEREAEIWDTLVRVQRRVSRSEYHALAEQMPPALPRSRRWRFMAGEPVEPAAQQPVTSRKARR
ncbi:MAG: radical SAM protein [Candidatus Schekmanbacteria bacterium]|nr:radical SAM protein [Candidatus Schekmanbacteria bacterium]